MLASCGRFGASRRSRRYRPSTSGRPRHGPARRRPPPRDRKPSPSWQRSKVTIRRLATDGRAFALGLIGIAGHAGSRRGGVVLNQSLRSGSALAAARSTAWASGASFRSLAPPRCRVGPCPTEWRSGRRATPGLSATCRSRPGSFGQTRPASLPRPQELATRSRPTVPGPEATGIILAGFPKLQGSWTGAYITRTDPKITRRP